MNQEPTPPPLTWHSGVLVAVYVLILFAVGFWLLT
jgi:hypothetical protein